MPRKLRRFIQIDKKFLETKKDDFIIVHTEKEFNDKCSQNAQMKNVHYLIQDEINQNQFKWQKSNGPISTLKKCLIMNKESEESIDEEDIFHKNNDKVLIISAEPGMGKSLILNHFTQKSSAENFFIKIILNTCTKTLSDKKFKENLQKREDDLIEFVLKSLLGKNGEQEIPLLKQLAKEEKLILMFDGLDEVNDYKEQVIQLIDALMRDCKLKKILITTRNHLREELEDHFNTFSFDLNNFDDGDQKNFLVKYWRSYNLKRQERPTSANKLMQTAEDLIERIKSISSENLNQLIGIPLQTKMLADICFERVKNKEDFSNLILTNIAVLYNEFIESKIKIQYEEKSKIEIKIDQDRFEEEKEKFYKNHERLSNLILFENKNKKDEKALTEKEEKRIIKYGVIVAFKNGIPTFLHQSFVEFFLAKICLQKVKEQNKRDKELKEILRDERHFLIRRFLNDLMENHENQKEQQEENKNEEKEDFEVEIENCCRENLISLLDYFIQDKGANLKTKNIFLIIASFFDHKHIVAFLLRKGIDVNQQDEDGYTALIWASERGHKEIVQMLLQHKNIDLNQKGEYGKTALMLASINGHKEIVEMLLQNKYIQINQQDKNGNPALMCASIRGHKEIVQMLLQNKNIQVNQQDKDGDTALMLASREGHKEIVQLLLQDKNIKINQQNKDRYTALIWASQKGHKEIVQMLLQHENIEINQQGEYGDSALIYASRNGHKEIVQMLLQHKNIDLNQKGEYGKTALITASKYGHKEIVEMLLKDKNIEINQQDNKYGKTALIYASENGHKEIVEMLLQHENIKINQQDKGGYTALMWASANGHENIARMLKDEILKKNQTDNYGKTALITASENGHKDIVETLLQDEKIDINQQDKRDGMTALMNASQKGHKEIVEMLLQDERIEINQQNKHGWTALMTASGRAHKEIVQILLQASNIEINQQAEYGWTALTWASREGHREVVQILLQHKNIQINQQDDGGYTALMMASFYGHKEIVEMLLQDKNIDINLQDENGKTALILASHEGHTEIVQMLLQDTNIQINLQNKYGATALMEASREGHTEVVQMLLQDKNIQINQFSPRGYTACVGDHRPVGRDRIRSRPKNSKIGRDPKKKSGRDRQRVATQK
jgi:ankyrin repeat protein